MEILWVYYNVGNYFISFRFEIHGVGFRPQWVYLSNLAPQISVSTQTPTSKGRTFPQAGSFCLRAANFQPADTLVQFQKINLV